MENDIKKTVWIINDYAGSPLHGMTHRHYYIAKELHKYGIKSTIISASYSHFFTSLPNLNGKKYLKENIDSVEYLWLKVLRYKDSHDKKRVFKWFHFMFRLMTLPKSLDIPDVIICSGSAPMLVWVAYFLAKKHNAKLIFEIRDIWPLTLIELNGYSPRNPLMYMMQKAMNFGCKNADVVISVLTLGWYKFLFCTALHRYMTDCMKSRCLTTRSSHHRFLVNHCQHTRHGDTTGSTTYGTVFSTCLADRL